MPTKSWILIIFICSFFLFSLEAQAAPKNVMDCLEEGADCEEVVPPTDNSGEPGNNISENSSSSLVLNIIKFVIILSLVIGLMYFVLKFLQSRNKLFQKVKAMENLGGIALGQNKSIQIVKIGSKLYLIGVGDNVELLQEITDEQIIREIMDGEDGNEGTSTSGTFKSLFPFKQNQKDKPAPFHQLFQAELDQLKENRRKLVERQKEKEDQHE